MPEVAIVITPEGVVTVEAIGAVGAGCLALTRALEDALGSVESRSCKTEFYEQAEAGEQVRQREV